VNTVTLYGQVLAKESDFMGYQSLVFKNLDTNAPFGHNYCLLTVFPNWESRIPDIGEIGYVNYDEVVGGVDKYYDRSSNSIIKYNYSNFIFKKFVRKVDNFNKDIIL
jgi:hypothetical protein